MLRLTEVNYETKNAYIICERNGNSYSIEFLMFNHVIVKLSRQPGVPTEIAELCAEELFFFFVERFLALVQKARMPYNATCFRADQVVPAWDEASESNPVKQYNSHPKKCPEASVLDSTCVWGSDSFPSSPQSTPTKTPVSHIQSFGSSVAPGQAPKIPWELDFCVSSRKRTVQILTW
jgi:hypothetical protein